MPPVRGAVLRLALFFTANVLFGAGLFAHAFLYNFYLQGLALGPEVMGLAAAALTAGGLTALAPAGVIADRAGARRGYGIAALLGAAGLAAGAFVTAVPLILAAAFLSGAGAAGWRVAMGPILMRIAHGERRARAFSWNVALLLASGAVWTAAAGSIPAWLETTFTLSGLAGIRAALVAGAAGTALSALVITFVSLSAGDDVATPTAAGAPGSPRAQGTGAPVAGAPPRSVAGGPPFLAAIRVPGAVMIAVVAVAVWMTAGGLVIPFFNIFFQQAHGLSVARIGVLFAIAQAVTALAVFISGEAASRLGARRVLMFWSVLLAPVLWMLVPAAALPLTIGLFLTQGFVAPATNPLIDQLLLEQAPPERHGAVSSWRNAATELSGLFGAGAGGYLLRAAGFDMLFITAGIVAVLGAAGLWLTLARGGEAGVGPAQSESAGSGAGAPIETLPRSTS